ncbi:MAG: ABATE domain-containing protein, partial [Thermomicrobiales bacterium]|nr:ABATE domain-containing protein [Thermomicrobiales bacterium]
MFISTATAAEVNRWPLRGGLPALDLTNTEAYRGRPYRQDLLQSYDLLVAWGIGAGVVAPSEAGPLLAAAAADPVAAARVLERTVELRSAVHVLMQRLAHGEPPPPAALAVLDAVRVEGQVHSELVPDAAGFSLRFTPAHHLALPLWRLADSASQLLTGGAWTRVRECPGHECG